MGQICLDLGIAEQTYYRCARNMGGEGLGLAENIDITYAEQGIKVFALCPQAVSTEMTKNGGGVAAVDGMMPPEQLADAVIEGFKREEFLILPHPEVKTYMQRKTADYDRWLKGMRRLQARFIRGAPLKK